MRLLFWLHQIVKKGKAHLKKAGHHTKQSDLAGDGVPLSETPKGQQPSDSAGLQPVESIYPSPCYSLFDRHASETIDQYVVAYL